MVAVALEVAVAAVVAEEEVVAMAPCPMEHAAI